MAVAIGGNASERLVRCSDLIEKTKEGERQLDRSWLARLEGMMKHLRSWRQV